MHYEFQVNQGMQGRIEGASFTSNDVPEILSKWEWKKERRKERKIVIKNNLFPVALFKVLNSQISSLGLLSRMHCTLLWLVYGLFRLYDRPYALYSVMIGLWTFPAVWRNLDVNIFDVPKYENDVLHLLSHWLIRMMYLDSQAMLCYLVHHLQS